ncbi:MAG: pentapeptide repeat-containing protein [Methanothrix sp.]
MGKINLALALILFLMLLHPAGAGDEEGMREVPAQEILDKIERGEPVEYDHVIVEGDLDLYRLELPKRWANRTDFEVEYIGLSEDVMLVSSSIRLNDSAINGKISFSNARFINPVDFSHSHLNGSAFFGDSAFNGTADFGGSVFNGTANFRGSAFNDYADFGGSVFNGTANFRGSDFNGTASFWRSAFNDDASFWYSDFNGTAIFWRSAFNDYADFRGSAFNGTADFRGSDFNDYADFRGSAFNGYADFEGSDFNGYASFWYSAFNGTAHFTDSAFNISVFLSVEFNKQVYFIDANFSNSTSFNSSRFKEDALFEGALFDGPLYLTRTKYDRLYIRWNSIKELGYDDAAYLALLENFKKLGYMEDYDACYYEYRRLHRDQPWSGRYHALHPAEEWLRKKIDLGLQAFYGYGKKPIWPLIWSAGTILLFGLIWRRAGVDGAKSQGGIFEKFSPGGEKKGKISLEEQSRALGSAMLFSATLFLSGTRLFVDPPAMPKMEGWLAAHARSFFIAERVLGAFFSILFFLAVSGTVVR